MVQPGSSAVYSEIGTCLTCPDLTQQMSNVFGNLSAGPMLHATTQVIFEGVPTYPTAARIWDIVDKYKVSTSSQHVSFSNNR